ncbi:hypothetical protein ONA23_06155 [Mycoplasmopsis cynos]|nr:hypothetical protein [Mycoplasmopsis cynos]MCU9936198.1 hypothetical protein [Mycoplasmopsis cynos]UWV82745.1 hypothetical protein NW067_00075 [Mycoplasmopsis cynos]UWV94036.1 hypothetical protein NW062_01815 [Mycoplasmopsis cynos]WAM06517.1 hypothetical protein ONA23_06155 [Mycoplasmopsis cynos]
MSRIGNSLNNREIEYFFSILKSEFFPDFSMKCWQMNFDELSYKNNEFVNWYNHKGIRLKCPKKFPLFILIFLFILNVNSTFAKTNYLFFILFNL